MPSIDLKDQYFGCEIEMTGLTRREAAEGLGALFGTQFRYLGGTYKTYEVPDREDKVWKIVYDSRAAGSFALCLRVRPHHSKKEFVLHI